MREEEKWEGGVFINHIRVQYECICKYNNKCKKDQYEWWIYFECLNERERKMRGRGLYQSHQSPIWMHEVSERPAAYFSESIDGQLNTINRQFSVIDLQLFVNNQLPAEILRKITMKKKTMW